MNFCCNFLRDEVSEPQSLVLARLCVYCIISNLDARHILPSKKRNRSSEAEDIDIAGGTKIRKLNPDGSDNSCSNDFISESTHQLTSGSNFSNKEIPITIKEPLQTSIQLIFKIFTQFLETDELSPKIYFIFQFISFLVECGKERVKPVLKLLPNNLLQNLLKVMVTDEITVGLICR